MCHLRLLLLEGNACHLLLLFGSPLSFALPRFPLTEIPSSSLSLSNTAPSIVGVQGEQESSYRFLESMDKNTCKLCLRRFSNGRALGGHMRAHVASSATNKPSPPPPPPTPPLLCSSSSSGPELEGAGHLPPAVVGSSGLYYDLRENPRKSFRLVDPDFSDFVVLPSNSAAIAFDGESETESCKLPVIGIAPSSVSRSRSKRRRRCSPNVAASAETEPDSSVSDEYVARCLMMLSRDSWSKSKQEQDVEDEEDEEERPGQLESEPSDAGKNLLPAVRSRKPSGKLRYRCCNKVFHSYQAFGGHRANHKKLKPATVVETAIIDEDHHLTQELDCERNGEESRIHECPVCFRAFGSGRALGGHKRAHIMSGDFSPPATGSDTTDPGTCAKFQRSFIDLNLPAPIDDEGIGSMVEVSAASHAE